MREKKSFTIVCFYCGRVFEYLTTFAYLINRAYCDRCKKLYLHDKWNKGKRWEAYRQYLQKIKNQFSFHKEENVILLQRRGEQLFRGEISLGEIKGEDEAFIYVQKNFGSVSSYRKELVKN